VARGAATPERLESLRRVLLALGGEDPG
jgi:hypothetical protein